MASLADALHHLAELLLIAAQKIVKRAISKYYAVFADIETVRSADCVCRVMINIDFGELVVDFL